MNRRFWIVGCAFVAALFVFQGWSIAEKDKADHLCAECAKKEAPSVTGKRMLKAVLQCEECGDMIATSMAPDDYKLCDSCAGKKGVCKWCLKPLNGQPATEGPDKTLVQGNNTFAFDLYDRLREEKGNIFLSPASISTALAMTYAGARGNTEAEMAKTLHFEIEQAKLHPAFAGAVEYLNAGGAKGGYQLTIANSLWGQKGYGFLPEFLKLTKDNYGAGFDEVDFAGDTEGARKIINDWVEKATKEKIKELIPEKVLTTLTRLVLTNAIYFKGDWAAKFDKAKTKDEPFQLTAEKSVNVPMMNQKSKFNYAGAEDIQVLELPYVGSDLAMVIFLPRKVDALPVMEGYLTKEFLGGWLKKLRTKVVEVALPKFKATKFFSLRDILIEMGMPEAFSTGADFSGMNGKKDLYIGAVLHKAFVEVNEEGTEAAAATAVIMETKGMPEPPPVFRADRPFFFVIRDLRSGSILFMGRIVNPLE